MSNKRIIKATVKEGKVLVSANETTTVKEFGVKACHAAQVEGKHMVMIGGCAVADEEFFLEMMGNAEEVEVEVVVVEKQEGLKRRIEEEGEEEEEGAEKRVKIEKEKDENEEGVMIPAQRIVEIRNREKVVEVLKKRYEKYGMERIEGEKEPENREHVKTVLKHRDQHVEIEDIFEKGKRLVIEGGAGMGKTSILREMTRKWSDGELWNDRFDALIYVRMEDIEVEMKATMNSLMMDVVKNEWMEESIVWFLKNRDWNKVLWIFDGWESVEIKGVLSGIERNEEECVRNVIFGTRKEGIECDRVLRLEGFDDGRIEEYIGGFFGENDEGLREMIKRDEWMKRLSRTPLILGTICGMRREDRKSTSEIMGRVVEMILKKSFVKNKWNSFPRDILSKTAYDCFVNDVLKINEGLLVQHCQRDVKMIEAIKQSGLIHKGSFIDESVVTYFAAEHVCHGMKEGIASEIVSVWNKKKEKSDLFMRCCVGIGGNAMSCLGEWVKKTDTVGKYLGPFEWINENKTGKLRQYLKEHWKHWMLKLDARLRITAEKGLVDTADLLLEIGADINGKSINGQTVLMYSCFETLEMVKYLVDKGADIHAVDSEGWNAIMYACRFGAFEMVKYLVDKGADIHAVDSEGWNALLLACRHGTFEMVKYLVDNGADINAVKNDGWNAIMSACQFGTLEMVKYLVDKGADINAVDNTGWNAVIYACRFGAFEIVKYLLDKGADINVVTKNGLNSLMLASCTDNVEIINYLVDKGLSINFKGSLGDTALFWACLCRNIEAIKCLISKGADINNIDDDGISIILRAHSKGFIDVVELLKDAKDYQLIERTNRCVLDNVCTSNASLEKKKVGQKVFLCKNCKIECCVVCKDTCHSKHQLEEKEFGLLRCGCGNKGIKCKAGPKVKMEKK